MAIVPVRMCISCGKTYLVTHERFVHKDSPWCRECNKLWKRERDANIKLHDQRVAEKEAEYACSRALGIEYPEWIDHDWHARQIAHEEAALEYSLEWIGTVVPWDPKTIWRCKKGHVFHKTLTEIKQYPTCPTCRGMLHGKRVSDAQLALAAQLSIPTEHINYRIAQYSADMVLMEQRIVIEYDAPRWHNAEKDRRRDEIIITENWKVLRIRAPKGDIPSSELVKRLIETLTHSTDSRLVHEMK